MDEVLRAFLNIDENRQIIGLALITIHKLVDGYKGKPDNLAVFIDIQEGPQYFIHNLDVQSAAKLDKAQLLSQLSSVEGQPFSEYNVAVDRDTVLQQYSTRGFPNATFEWSSKRSEERRVDRSG